MDHARVVLVVACAALAAVAGCASDLEREPLDSGWEASVTVHDAPSPLVDERPAQVVVEGPLTVAPDRAVELTGFEGELAAGNATLELRPARIAVDGQARPPAAALGNGTTLEDGTRVRLTLVPAEPQSASLEAGPANVTVSLQYRHRDGDRFDAGRFTANATGTPVAAGAGGLGVARTGEDGVTSLVFADLDDRLAPPVTVAAYHVGPDGVTYEGHLDASLSRGEGVAVATLADAEPVPQGEGYLVFRVDAGGVEAAAVQPDHAPDQPLPLPGWLAFPALAAAGLAAARRSGRFDGEGP